MKVYIQSKSGNYNTTNEIFKAASLEAALMILRNRGGYLCRFEEAIFVPFEEIEYIKEKPLVN
jgi:hypothetical protein